MINTVTHINILTRYYLCIRRFVSERMISISCYRFSRNMYYRSLKVHKQLLSK